VWDGARLDSRDLHVVQHSFVFASIFLANGSLSGTTAIPRLSTRDDKAFANADRPAEFVRSKDPAVFPPNA